LLTDRPYGALEGKEKALPAITFGVQASTHLAALRRRARRRQKRAGGAAVNEDESDSDDSCERDASRGRRHNDESDEEAGEGTSRRALGGGEGSGDGTLLSRLAGRVNVPCIAEGGSLVLRHPPPAVERLMHGVAAPGASAAGLRASVSPAALLRGAGLADWEAALPGLLARRGRGRVLLPVAYSGRPLQIVSAAAAAAAASAASMATGGAAGAPAAASSDAAAEAAAATASRGVRVGSSARFVAPRRAGDLSLRAGAFALLEYAEQHPPLLGGAGMASQLLTLVRDTAASAAGGGAGEDDEAGPGTSAAVAAAAVAAFAAAGIDVGGGGGSEDLLELVGRREALPPQARFPMLGLLEPGQRVAAVANGLFSAPLFPHEPAPCDFLLVLRHERGQAAAAAAGAGAGSISGPGRAGGRSDAFVGYLRPLQGAPLFTVGQTEPRQRVLSPGVRSSKRGASGGAGVMVVDRDTARFLRAACCYTALLMFARVDEAILRAHGTAAAAIAGGSSHAETASHHHHQHHGGGLRPLGAVLEEAPPPPPGHAGAHAAAATLRPGVLALSEVTARLQAAFGPRAVRHVAAYLSEVADVDAARGLLVRKPDAPPPEEYREAVELSPDHVCLYAALQAGEAALRQAGLVSLCVADKQVEDAVRVLQGLYDATVARLKAATATPAAAAGGAAAAAAGAGAKGAAGGGGGMWEHDGGYRRLRRTLEAAQAIYYMLQCAPWSTSQK